MKIHDKNEQNTSTGEDVRASGGVAQRIIKDGSYMFTAPGTINGVQGIYTIGVTQNGVIFHRTFYEWALFLKKF